MLKKIILITISVLMVIGVIAGVFIFKKITYQDEEAKFRKSLKGEIVFVRRDGLYLNIYKINADGTDEKFLYHHDLDEPNLNSSSPEWAEDGIKIYFTAMKDKKWERFMMNSDGKNVKFATGKFTVPANHWSREDDIIVDLGSIYYLDESGKKNLVFAHKNYDPDMNPGAWVTSWSPEKEYIICVLHGYITIINKEGTKMTKITKGAEPDWKY